MNKGIWYATEAREGGYYWVVDVHRVDENTGQREKIGEAPGVTLRDAMTLAGEIMEAD